ncbi:MAG: penicillin acylase family protein, partial [Microcoleaceae cyanobacterium]
MIKKFMKNGAIALIIFSLCISICAVLIVRNSFPQTSGKITIPGLIATVTVKRDKWGVPHIYAENTHDLFMAQGYVHAQDRFWQMDFWRHIGAGQLAEMLGKSQVNIDRFIKTLGWARVAATELKLLDKNTLEILQAYTDGVNSYLNTHQGIQLSLEYALLKVLNPGYQPAPWQIINSLTWGKVMAFDLSFNLDQEIERSILSRGFSPQQMTDLFPPYPTENPLIVPDFPLAKKQNKLNEISLIDDQILDNLAETAEIFDQLKSLINDAGAGIGSNNWVIAGKRTTTGKPLLADDTHLTVKMPSIWYEVGLHCVSKNQSNIRSNIELNKDCPYNVTGFS